MIESVSISSLQENDILDFGAVILSDDDIIRFATQYDPMPFHIDKEVAKKSHFGELIASGPHLFHVFYNREWVPRFKHTVFAGKGINNWMLRNPVYTNTRSHCKVHIRKIEPKPGRPYTVVHWFFEFTNDQHEILQSLDLIVLHYTEP